MSLGDLNKVWEVKPLKRKPKEDEARNILNKIAKQVQPIMHKRKWRVKLLSEFCPSTQRLLGLNVGRGIHVKLRLRRPGNDLSFYPFDEVLDTMLHELCHNKYGPHNADFYKLWDELRKECEELMRKGITGSGEGFDIPGKRLGGFSRQPPLTSLRQKALTAAENRSKIQSLLPSGPKRLGGDSSMMTALSPIQAAAMAAERRAQDDIWCGSHSFEILDEESTSSASGIKAISDKDHDVSNGNKPRKRIREPPHKSSGNCRASGFKNVRDESSSSGTVKNQDASIHGSSLLAVKPSECESDVGYLGTKFSETVPASACCTAVLKGEEATSSKEWECRLCTFLNLPLALMCNICCSERPKDSFLKFKTWSCKSCTLENSVEVEKCLACEQWRSHSYGPPISTRSPNIGT